MSRLGCWSNHLIPSFSLRPTTALIFFLYVSGFNFLLYSDDGYDQYYSNESEYFNVQLNYEDFINAMKDLNGYFLELKKEIKESLKRQKEIKREEEKSRPLYCHRFSCRRDDDSDKDSLGQDATG